jgi:CRISPR-associated endonuclease/helicase Cas3
LIEFVYGSDEAPDDNGWPGALSEAKKKMEFERTESEKKACSMLVSRPKAPADLVEDFNDQLADDEDPSVHKQVRAATREGDPSITVVILPDGESLTTNPKIPEVKELLDRSVKISHRGLFHAFLEHGDQPKEWKDNVHLRHARLLRLNDQSGLIEGYSLRVDESLGVVIAKRDTE